MNHKAELLDWDQLSITAHSLEEQKRWRELLLVACATYTGCRPGDFTKFTWSVFMDEKGVVKQKTSFVERKPKHIMAAKGKKATPRPIYIIPEFQKTLRMCWDGLGQPRTSCYMLTGERGPRGEGISTNTANTWLKKIAKEFGLPKNITNYFFRKTGGRRIHDSQTNPVMAVQLARTFYNHQSIETTMRYIGLTDAEALGAFQQLSL